MKSREWLEDVGGAARPDRDPWKLVERIESPEDLADFILQLSRYVDQPPPGDDVAGLVNVLNALDADPKAPVKCPRGGKEELRVLDTPLLDGKFDRYLKSPTCGLLGAAQMRLRPDGSNHRGQDLDFDDRRGASADRLRYETKATHDFAERIIKSGVMDD